MSHTLLYIDSDPATRRLVSRVLSPNGLRVIEAASISQAHTLITQTRPDVVVVDVDAAGDIDDVVPALGQGNEGGRRVFLAVTAEDRPQYLTRVAEAGFAAVLSKPLDIDRLVADVGRYLPVPPPQEEAAVEAQHLEGESVRAALWRQTLTPLTVHLVRSVATSEGVLVLRRDGEDDWVVVAAHSVRQGAVLSSAGARVSAAAAKWLGGLLANREPVAVESTPLEGSGLLPAECRSALVAPVKDGDRTYGAVVLGERRQRTFGFPPAQIAHCMAETAKIATVLTRFQQLDEAIVERRRAIEEMRLNAAHAVTGVHDDAVERERITRLAMRLAERLDLPAEERIVLEHGLRVHDVGRAWLAREVLPLGMLSAEDGQALLETQTPQTLEILRALDCSPAVIEAVRMAALPFTEAKGEAGLTARILAVIATYRALTGEARADGGPLSPKDAMAEISGQAGRRFDPSVVSALTDLVGTMGMGEVAAD